MISLVRIERRAKLRDDWTLFCFLSVGSLVLAIALSQLSTPGAILRINSSPLKKNENIYSTYAPLINKINTRKVKRRL